MEKKIRYKININELLNKPEKKIKFVMIEETGIKKGQKSFVRYCAICGCVGTFTHVCIESDHKRICKFCNKVYQFFLIEW
jgi:hypothetical protein